MRGALPLAAVLLAAWLAPAGAATITIINNDGPGEGFNDPTLVAPVGGNPGTTLGQQRMNLFQHAADMWASILTSAVAIRVAARFDPIVSNPPCSASGGVLGSTGTGSLHANFAGAPMPNTQYNQALANKYAGMDLSAADDMNITYNSDVDNPVCLGDRDWYYGYDGNEGNDIELLPVVLHEIGHGLGFTSQVATSGAFAGNGMPTLYSRFTLDVSNGLYWSAMTNGQRATSFINTGNVVWDGAAVNAQAPLILEARRILTVNAPAGIAGTYLVGTASFGADVSNPVVTALVALADDGVAPPNDACEPLINGPALAGKVALIDRGTCTFVLKAQAAQAAGAVGVIIADNVSSPSPPELGGADASITIPVVGITMADGNLLKANLGSGVNVTLGGQHPTARAGLHANGKALLYAPNPVEPGSSISHWDRTALPHLLMEPAINQSLHTWIDLTRYQFKDLGWFPGGATVGVGPVAGGLSEPLRSVPNPFAAFTAIHFRLDREGGAELDVFDLGGRRVRHFAASDLPPGPHAIAWDGRDETGARAPAGVYLVRLTHGGRTETGRTVRLE